MSDHPLAVAETNLSRAWASAFLNSLQRGHGEVMPLIVTVTEFNDGIPVEDTSVRRLLDTSLAKNGMRPVETVASTIFPRSLWNPVLPSAELYKRYRQILPRIAQDDPLNKYGTYFQRLILYDPTLRGLGRDGLARLLSDDPPPFNQLDEIIQAYKAGATRRTALQASTFCPQVDLNRQRRRGFPCLQQVTFSPDTHEKSLAVTGFYAYQTLFERAYGNYLGLCHLGRFMAHELGLTLRRMTCVAAIGKRDVKSEDVTDFITELKNLAAEWKQTTPT